MSAKICRACGAQYEYPAFGSLASRAHCADCALIEDRIRRLFDKMRQQIVRLEAQVDTLNRKIDAFEAAHVAHPTSSPTATSPSSRTSA